jgi:hypothetical protein
VEEAWKTRTDVELGTKLGRPAATDTDTPSPSTREHIVTKAVHSTTPSSTKPRVMAVVSRWADDLGWLTDNSTGPRISDLLEVVVYQPAGIDPAGRPEFPGLDPATASPLPTWPEWAKKYVTAKLETLNLTEPGSVHDAKRLAQEEAAKANTALKAAALGEGKHGSGIGEAQAAAALGLGDGYDDLGDEIASLFADRQAQGILNTIDAAGTPGRRRQDVPSSIPQQTPPDSAAQRAAGEGHQSSSALVPWWLLPWLPSRLAQREENVTEVAEDVWLGPSAPVITQPQVSEYLDLRVVPNRGGESMVRGVSCFMAVLFLPMYVC